MKTTLTILLSLMLFATNVFSQDKEDYQVNTVHYLEVNASINPAIYNYLQSNLNKYNSANRDLAIIKLDTPGGLVTTTKDILTLFGKQDIPIIVWITPEGASATSAGAIIASGAHKLFMSRGTNIGAATPVAMGKDLKESDGRSKAINDLVALVRSLSKSRGRNADEFAKMISEAKSLDANSAEKLNVIDGIVNSQQELQQKLNKVLIQVKDKHYEVSVSSNVTTKEHQMDPGQQILNIFSDPSFAYVLFIIGAALIYFELQAPGGFISGGLGAICLLLAGIGFQVLPLNMGALALIVLSFILFVAEVYITSFGVLALGGILSLVFGSLFLFRTEDSFIELQASLVYSVVAAVLICMGFITWFMIRTYQKPKNQLSKLRQKGLIIKVLEDDLYHLKLSGEIWKATSKDKLAVHDEVEVIGQQEGNLTLIIKKA